MGGAQTRKFKNEIFFNIHFTYILSENISVRKLLIHINSIITASNRLIVFFNHSGDLNITVEKDLLLGHGKIQKIFIVNEPREY